MHFKRFLIVLTIVLLSISVAGCKQGTAAPADNALESAVDEPAVNAPVGDEEPEPTEEPTPTEDPAPTETPEPAAEEITLVPFQTDDGIFTILMPEGWATNQVPLDTGIAFGIVPTEEDISTGPAVFDRPVIMVYGSVEQIRPDMAEKQNVVNFHNYN